jgi:hypothetical protein
VTALFGAFEFVRFEFVSDFEFRASDLVAASPRYGLRLADHASPLTNYALLFFLKIPHFSLDKCLLLWYNIIDNLKSLF